MTISQQLGVKEFPFIIKDNKENLIYWEGSNGYWWKSEYDDKGKQIYWEQSDGYWWKIEYDDKGKVIYFEDSSGRISDKRPESQQQTVITKIGRDGIKIGRRWFICATRY